MAAVPICHAGDRDGPAPITPLTGTRSDIHFQDQRQRVAGMLHGAQLHDPPSFLLFGAFILTRANGVNRRAPRISNRFDSREC